MGLFSFFAKKTATLAGGQLAATLSAGDIFYTAHDGRYHIYKLLKIDEPDTFHVLGYQPQKKRPEPKDIPALEIFAYHFPVDRGGFEKPVLLLQSTVTSDDLTGYYEYVRQTHAPEEIAVIANEYYLQGNQLAEKKEYAASIDVYSKAISLVPDFFEAIDNRAFSKMDLAHWSEAIEDFELSLTVHPDSRVATFSIGECYLRLEDYANAKKHFEKNIAVEPSWQPARDFLLKTNNLITERFEASWHDAADFYDDLIQNYSGWDRLISEKTFIQQMRARGEDKFFRAGISVYRLILSRSIKHGLRPDQQHLIIDQVTENNFTIMFRGGDRPAIVVQTNSLDDNRLCDFINRLRDTPID